MTHEWDSCFCVCVWCVVCVCVCVCVCDQWVSLSKQFIFTSMSGHSRSIFCLCVLLHNQRAPLISSQLCGPKSSLAATLSQPRGQTTVKIIWSRVSHRLWRSKSVLQEYNLSICFPMQPQNVMLQSIQNSNQFILRSNKSNDYTRSLVLLNLHVWCNRPRDMRALGNTLRKEHRVYNDIWYNVI